MRKSKEQEPLPEVPEVPVPEVPAEPVNGDALVTVNKSAIRSVFSGGANRIGSVRSLKLKAVLTKPLIAMAHEKELVFTATSEMYQLTLPSQARGAAPRPARVIDGIDIGRAQECTLIMNEMMVGALKRGGYSVLVPEVKDDVTVGYSQIDGNPLTGKSFAFEQGTIQDDEGYRKVNCAEVEIEY